MRWGWIIGVLVLLLGGGAVWNWGLRGGQASAVPQKTVTVKKGNVRAIVTAPGQVVPKRQTTVYTKNGGMVAKLSVKQGQEVEAGQVLLRFDTSALQTQVASLRTQVAAAQASLKDLQAGSKQADVRLAQDAVKQAELDVVQAKQQLTLNEADLRLGAIPAQQVAAAHTALQRAQGNLESARLRATQAVQGQTSAVSSARAQLEAARFQQKSLEEQIAGAVVKSPMNGSVIELHVAQGQAVAASSAVAQIADLSSWVVQNRVAESDLPSLEVGMPVTVVVNAIGDTELEGKITQLGQVQKFKDPLYYYQVDAALTLEEPPSGLTPGLSTTATFVTEEAENVPLIPINALQSQGSKTVVEVKTLEGTRKVIVETGLDDGTNIEIKKGLKVGDTVVLPPPPGSGEPQNAPGGLGQIVKF
jgi:RND family efflux transporter MFP subunit